MQLFEGYSAEELSRILTTSRWVFCTLLVLAVVAGFFTQWLGGQMVAREREDRTRASARLAAAELELRQSDSRVKDLGATLGRLTIPRRLSNEQLAKIRAALREGAKGAVVVSFVITEWDAEAYARQMANVLVEAGFDAKVSEFLLPGAPRDGVFVCAAADGKPTAQATGIQAAFAGAGVEIEAHSAPDIVKESGAAEGAVVLVVSNRK